MAAATRLSTDPYDILLGHNRWATRTLIERCRPLSDEDFHRRFDIGPGSLHDTLTHIVGCIGRWTDAIADRPVRPALEGRRHTPDELLRTHESTCDEFAAVVAERRPVLGEARDWPSSSGTYRFTVGAAVIHVTNHGMHHRAQCMNMLKRLGRPVDADLDELEWQIAGEP